MFLPDTLDHGTTEKLPAVFTIHGGGFVLGDPSENDTWNSLFANRANVVVVSLNYRKAPVVQFPTPIHDLEALVEAVLADDELPIDGSRLAVAGFSAGGNLALALAQLPSMRGRFRAAVPHYPAADMTVSREVKERTRRYKPELGGFRARPVDYLLPLAPLFDWAYVPRGADMSDPLLSPVFAAAETLPPYIFMIGCELDMLVGENRRMICKLAGRPGDAVDEHEDAVDEQEDGGGGGGVAEKKGGDKTIPPRVGRQELGEPGELILDDERFHFEDRTPSGGAFKWLLVPDAVHGFDHDIPMLTKDADLWEDASAKRDKVHKMIAEWLRAGPFARGESSPQSAA